MIQFNINRFGRLARWTLISDRAYYVKMLLQVVLILTLAFMLLTSINQGQQEQNLYKGCLFVAVFALAITFIAGPSMMFFSMKGKHDRQTLMLLPASNFEKYLMRYATWIIHIPILVVGYLAADLLQFVLNYLMGHDYVTLIVPHILSDLFSSARFNMWVNGNEVSILSFVVGCLTLHSIYALGATFFRSYRHNTLLTTLCLIVFGMLILWLFDTNPDETRVESLTWEILENVVSVAWTVFNFWLSYRLFCRTQLKARFVNI